MGIGISIDKVKQIAHAQRRLARAQEFAPLDVKATIPSEAQQAEELRQQVREKYVAMQQLIDGAQSPDEVRAALSSAA